MVFAPEFDKEVGLGKIEGGDARRWLTPCLHVLFDGAGLSAPCAVALAKSLHWRRKVCVSSLWLRWSAPRVG